MTNAREPFDALQGHLTILTSPDVLAQHSWTGPLDGVKQDDGSAAMQADGGALVNQSVELLSSADSATGRETLGVPKHDASLELAVLDRLFKDVLRTPPPQMLSLDSMMENDLLGGADMMTDRSDERQTPSVADVAATPEPSRTVVMKRARGVRSLKIDETHESASHSGDDDDDDEAGPESVSAARPNKRARPARKRKGTAASQAKKRVEQNKLSSQRYREKQKNRLAEIEARLEALSFENERLKEVVAASNTAAQPASARDGVVSQIDTSFSGSTCSAFVSLRKAVASGSSPAVLSASLREAEMQEAVSRKKRAQEHMVMLLRELDPSLNVVAPEAVATTKAPFDDVATAANPLGLNEVQLNRVLELRTEYTSALVAVLRRRGMLVQSLRAAMRMHMADFYAARVLGEAELTKHPGYVSMRQLLLTIEANFDEEVALMDSVTADFYRVLTPAQEAKWLLSLCDVRFCRFSVLMSIWKFADTSPLPAPGSMESK